MANDVENSANRVKQRPLRVLLVEDNPDDVELCLHIMRKTYPDVHCDVVQRPLEFARRIRTAHYDVILSDYALGPWTGLDVFNLMRKAGRDLPFILLTGALGDERAIECITSGITDYVLKGHPERLAVAISSSARTTGTVRRTRAGRAYTEGKRGKVSDVGGGDSGGDVHRAGDSLLLRESSCRAHHGVQS